MKVPDFSSASPDEILIYFRWLIADIEAERAALPLILTRRKTRWNRRSIVLLKEGDWYRPIAACVLRLRLKEIGREALTIGPRRDRSPTQIIREHGKIVSREEYDRHANAGR